MNRDRLSESRSSSTDRLSESRSSSIDRRPGITGSRKGERPESRRPQPEERSPAREQTPLLSPGELTTQSPTTGDYVKAFCNFMMRCCSGGTTSDTPSRPASPPIIPFRGRFLVSQPEW